MNVAQVSNSPRRARSCGPVTWVTPLVPSTSARTMRGDAPRSRTVIPRNEPRTNPFNLACTVACDMVNGPQL